MEPAKQSRRLKDKQSRQSQIFSAKKSRIPIKHSRPSSITRFSSAKRSRSLPSSTTITTTVAPIPVALLSATQPSQHTVTESPSHQVHVSTAPSSHQVQVSTAPTVSTRTLESYASQTMSSSTTSPSQESTSHLQTLIQGAISNVIPIITQAVLAAINETHTEPSSNQFPSGRITEGTLYYPSPPITPLILVNTTHYRNSVPRTMPW
ncbi:hypothetical protein SNE40_020686 [Patella caerulea]|uniref:Uncharacterized protein n=1 Tax=Patella caerulea TaxID=87958 RepID=A0AAN8PBJ8_PATCE